MNEVVQLQVKKVWPDLGSSDKSTEMAGMEWFWTREVEKTRSDNIRGVSFTVYLDENKTRNLAQIKAFITNPANNNRQRAAINNQNNTNNTTGNTGTGQRK
jgi:general secretion pathway protein I